MFRFPFKAKLKGWKIMCLSWFVYKKDERFTWDKLKENEENDKILQESSIKLNQKYLEMFEKVVF